MAALTVRTSDRAKLSAQQVTDLARIDAVRLQEYIEGTDIDGKQIDLRDKFFDRVSAVTDEQFRSRVNIVGVGATVEFAPESNYSADDEALIQAVRPRVKWLRAIPELLEAAATLRDDGMGEASILAMLRQTNR